MQVFSFASETIDINSSDLKFIGKNTDFLVDEDGEYALPTVLNKLASGDFQPVEEDILLRASSIPTYWLTFTANSTLDEEAWLHLSNSNLNNIDFYKLDLEDNVLDEYHTGSTFDRSTRAYDCHTFLFPLIKADDPLTYRFVLRIKSSLVMEAPIKVGSFKEITKNKSKSDFFAVLFLGAMFILFLYNIFLFVFTRDRVYIYYSFYIVSIAFGTSFLNNYPVLEYAIGAEITYNYTACWLWTNLIGIGVFAIEYLNIRKKYPKIFTLLWAEMGLILLYAVLNIFISSDRLSLSYQLVVVIFYVTCLVTAYHFMLKEKNGRAILYSVGWTFMMFGGIIFLLVINGIVPYNGMTRNAMYFGVTIEVLIFSIALARRLNRLKARQEKMNVALAQTNQVLKENNESLDSFNYHVSHDLKTVLNNSNALARMIRKYNDKGDQEKVAEITDKLYIVTKNGAETVQSFLTLGKVNSIFQNEKPERVNLSSELEMIMERHGLNGAIQVEITEDKIGQMFIHEKAFESIFLNLLTNSVKYNEREPKASIAFLEDETKRCFLYKDNGIGIDLENYGDNLFKPFQRAGVPENVEGTGIGLYTIKKIVENYGGTVTIESELGQGTTFIIDFPKK